ncbi:MAG: hypothetical protein OEM50_00960 [Gammaproteobacteria bacterium]|nr:hypothetical protein [Gammaproteobacteria bacterium]MDH3362614.1 hypothetical protein [Gammaproteobacteria bacterium]MDH3480254.1 hypothetical protein [Gammaproteobacteria bacterium]
MIISTPVLRPAIALLLLACLLAGCGGTKMLKEPQPIQTTRPLAAAADQRVSSTLDWVIVRDGPGTWARNADWDEYLLRISNQSGQPIQVTRLTVVDSLDTRIGSQPGRKQLVKGSKKTAKRYKKSGMRVRAGRGAGVLMAGGAAVTVAGYGVAAASIGLGGVSTGAATAAGGLLLLGPALAVGGVVRGVNNSKVNTQIEQRQTELPLEIPASEELGLDVFFPLAPSPKRVELVYTDATGEHRLVIDTSTALDGLHIDAPAD